MNVAFRKTLFISTARNDNDIFRFLVTPRGYALGKGHHESPVHRNPYDTHDAYDAIRTQDADLAVSHTITDLMRVIWFRLASVRKRLSHSVKNFGFRK